MEYFTKIVMSVAMFAVIPIGSSESSKDLNRRFAFKPMNSSGDGMIKGGVGDEVAPAVRELIQGMKTEMKLLRNKYEELEDGLDLCKANNHKTEQENKQKLDQMTSMIKQLTSGGLSRAGTGVSIPVAFSSYINEFGGLPFKLHDGAIVFNSETIDNTDAYDPYTGVFTAPIDGVYLFTYFVAIYNSDVITTQLLLDKKIISSAIADTLAEPSQTILGGNVAILQVNKGQRVKVTCVGDSHFLISLKYRALSSFSGFLLYVA